MAEGHDLLINGVAKNLWTLRVIVHDVGLGDICECAVCVLADVKVDITGEIHGTTES